MIHALASTDAEIGLAFDGDGDRLGVVTKEGNIIYPDRQMMLFAGDVLSRNPKAKIIYDVKMHPQPGAVDRGKRRPADRRAAPATRSSKPG